jgi:hypothetical protein
MHHRMRLFDFSVAAIALIAIGVVVRQGGFAQDDYSTPPAQDNYSTPAAATGAPAEDTNAEASVQYLGFISTVASNLGISDPMTVDAAIKTMLTQIVDDRVNAGEISDTDATALKARIDADNVAPLLFNQAGQNDPSASGSDAQTPTDSSPQQNNGNDTQQAPTETPDPGYYGY